MSDLKTIMIVSSVIFLIASIYEFYWQDMFACLLGLSSSYTNFITFIILKNLEKRKVD